MAAKALADIALNEAREQLPERHRKLALLTLSRIHNETGAHAEAQSLAQEALNITQRHVSTTPGWYCVILDVLACIASNKGNALLAARLFGAAETDYASVHLAVVMLEAHQLDAFNGHRAIYNEHANAPYIAKAKTILGEGVYQSAFTEGQAMTVEQVVALALSLL